MNVILPFKRKSTTFIGGECNLTSGSAIEAAKQPVEIVRCDEPDEDIWRVRTAAGQSLLVNGWDLRPHPEEAETNVEFITRMMEWGQGGALLQAFILNAVEEQAKATLTATAEELDTGLISGAAWRECAREALGWFAARDMARKGQE